MFPTDRLVVAAIVGEVTPDDIANVECPARAMSLCDKPVAVGMRRKTPRVDDGSLQTDIMIASVTPYDNEREPMPIHLDISHIDRLVVAVVIGEVTPDDILSVAREFMGTGAQHYRKIIDTTAGSATIDDDRLEAIAAFARSDSRAAFRGPLAFVVDAKRGEYAEKFAQLTADERPVKVFHSLHQARRWLNDIARVQPQS